MKQSAREELCDKIAKLKSELAAYESDLKRMDDEATSKFKEKVELMVGRYYMDDFCGSIKYYHIDSVLAVLDSEDDGNCVKLWCATVFNPDHADCYMQLEAAYFSEEDVDDLKPISKEEIDCAADKFINKFKENG